MVAWTANEGFGKTWGKVGHERRGEILGEECQHARVEMEEACVEGEQAER